MSFSSQVLHGVNLRKTRQNHGLNVSNIFTKVHISQIQASPDQQLNHTVKKM